jgi:hypothetical protein
VTFGWNLLTLLISWIVVKELVYATAYLRGALLVGIPKVGSE